MHASGLVEEYPLVGIDSDALDAARILATRRLPGLVVTEESGRPYAILPASQVVKFVVPRYIQDDPSLAGVIDESAADRIAARLVGKTVRDLLPEHPTELPTVRADDTMLELAAIMARLRSPLVVVVDDDEIVGVVTASRLLSILGEPL
ncbi:MAG: CBS domain-containing protein [Kribbellaceae bacterium]